MPHVLNITTSTIASTLRSWRGTSTTKTDRQPELDIILFDREGCSECRFVREALTELNLNVMIAPCPINGRNFRKLKRDSGSDALPRLVDSNTDQILTGRDDIIRYLFDEYRGSSVPKRLQSGLFNNTQSKIVSLVRLNAGIHAKNSSLAEHALTLYSFESSPFSRPVRELLCELELPYFLVNLGKQQLADMGSAKFHFTLKSYRPIKNTKRDEFFKKYGNVQVPFLIDPNTGTEMFESKDILHYLMETYAN